MLVGLLPLSVALHRLASHDLRRCPEGEGSVPVRSSEGRQALDIGSFQYSRGNEKALRLRKALIPLVFLAPRPGLEPGTYGLTVGGSDRAAGRANAHFRGSGLQYFRVVHFDFHLARAPDDHWILESFPPQCLVVRLCCFVDLGMAAELAASCGARPAAAPVDAAARSTP